MSVAYQEANYPSFGITGSCHFVNNRIEGATRTSEPNKLLGRFKNCALLDSKQQALKHCADEIRQMTAKNDWRYCPGMQSPADLPSPGFTGNEMVNNSMWWCGPQLLQLPEKEWPQEQATVDTNQAALSEVVKNPPNVIHVLTSCEEIPTEVNLAKIINCHQISSLDRLLRVTAYVLQFVDILK